MNTLKLFLPFIVITSLIATSSHAVSRYNRIQVEVNLEQFNKVLSLKERSSEMLYFQEIGHSYVGNWHWSSQLFRASERGRQNLQNNKTARQKFEDQLETNNSEQISLRIEREQCCFLGFWNPIISLDWSFDLESNSTLTTQIKAYQFKSLIKKIPKDDIFSPMDITKRSIPLYADVLRSIHDDLIQSINQQGITVSQELLNFRFLNAHRMRLFTPWAKTGIQLVWKDGNLVALFPPATLRFDFFVEEPGVTEDVEADELWEIEIRDDDDLDLSVNGRIDPPSDQSESDPSRPNPAQTQTPTWNKYSNHYPFSNKIPSSTRR